MKLHSRLSSNCMHNILGTSPLKLIKIIGIEGDRHDRLRRNWWADGAQITWPYIYVSMPFPFEYLHTQDFWNEFSKMSGNIGNQLLRWLQKRRTKYFSVRTYIDLDRCHNIFLYTRLSFLKHTGMPEDHYNNLSRSSPKLQGFLISVRI